MDPDPVQAQVDAFNAHDVEAYVACFDADAVVEGPDGAVMMRGHEEIRAFYRQFFGESPNLHVEIVNRLRVGAFVVDERQVAGAVMEGFPGEMHALLVYRLDGERIAQERLLM